MSLYATDDEAVDHEVRLATLKAGQRFELYTSTRVRAGVLIDAGWGTCTVLVEGKRPAHIIRTQDGREVEVKESAGTETWAPSSLVVPLNEFVDLNKLNRTSTNGGKGETDMAKKVKANGSAEPKAKKSPKPKEYKVVRYESAKADTEKGKKLLEAETHNGTIFQTLDKAGAPLSFDELKAAVGKKFDSDSKNPDSILRWHINDLKKKGLVKASVDKVEAKSKAEAQETPATEAA